jgi:hypothetical protein
MLIKEQNVEECDATNDAIKKLKLATQAYNQLLMEFIDMK